MNKSTLHLFLIHGLGGRPISMFPLEWFLGQTYTNIHRISYPSKSVDLKTAIEHVNDAMHTIIEDQQNCDIVVIGQSLGGLICHGLHKYDWNIILSITIGSPHHGSMLLQVVERSIPTRVADFLRLPVYADLLERLDAPLEVPPHPYHTISTSFFPLTTFDGQVFSSETALVEEHHHHIPYNNHWTICVDPRMFFLVNDIIEKGRQSELVVAPPR